MQDIDTWTSTTCYNFILASCAINWTIEMQPIVVLSTTKVEYMAITHVTKKII